MWWWLVELALGVLVLATCSKKKRKRLASYRETAPAKAQPGGEPKMTLAQPKDAAGEAPTPDANNEAAAQSPGGGGVGQDGGGGGAGGGGAEGKGTSPPEAKSKRPGKGKGKSKRAAEVPVPAFDFTPKQSVVVPPASAYTAGGGQPTAATQPAKESSESKSESKAAPPAKDGNYLDLGILDRLGDDVKDDLDISSKDPQKG